MFGCDKFGLLVSELDEIVKLEFVDTLCRLIVFQNFYAVIHITVELDEAFTATKDKSRAQCLKNRLYLSDLAPTKMVSMSV